MSAERLNPLLPGCGDLPLQDLEERVRSLSVERTCEPVPHQQSRADRLASSEPLQGRSAGSEAQDTGSDGGSAPP